MSDDWRVRDKETGFDIEFNFCHYTDRSGCTAQEEVPDNFAQRKTPIDFGNPGDYRGCIPLTSN